MQRVRQAAEHLKTLEPYDPKYLPARVYLNANENPFGLLDKVRKDLIHALNNEPLHRYPDPLAKRLRNALALKFDVPNECVLLGNGGDELLFDLCLAYGGKGRTLLTAPPTFSVYQTDALLTHTKVVEVPRVKRLSPEMIMSRELDTEAVLTCIAQDDIDIIMLTSPNNPTGDCFTVDFIEEMLISTDAVVLIDHAYLEFAAKEYDATPLLKKHANLAILRTFSKAYGLAGLRIGYLIASEQITRELCKVRQPYSVDALAALAALSALEAEDEVQDLVASIVSERKRVALGLRGLGLPVAHSEANYLLFCISEAQEVWQQLYDRQGILIRDLSRSPDLDDCLRVSIGTAQENDAFLQALRQIIQERQV